MNSISPETTMAEDAMACLAPAELERFERLKGGSTRLSIAQAELVQVEKRLGTIDERPDDLRRAVALGHEIRNVLCICVLRSSADSAA